MNYSAVTQKCPNGRGIEIQAVSRKRYKPSQSFSAASLPTRIYQLTEQHLIYLIETIAGGAVIPIFAKADFVPIIGEYRRKELF